MAAVGLTYGYVRKGAPCEGAPCVTARGLKDECGALTLEACISVFAFLILMFLMSSIFILFMAQNATAHATLQTAQSLSLDAYSAETIGTGGAGSVQEFVVSITDFVSGLFGTPASGNGTFATNDDWYSDADDLSAALEKRFVAYFAGGDEDYADELCQHYKIKDGLDGLDFSESYISNNTLYIVLRYEFENDYEFWGMHAVEVEQTACSVLWKSKS